MRQITANEIRGEENVDSEKCQLETLSRIFPASQVAPLNDNITTPFFCCADTHLLPRLGIQLICARPRLMSEQKWALIIQAGVLLSGCAGLLSPRSLANVSGGHSSSEMKIWLKCKVVVLEEIGIQSKRDACFSYIVNILIRRSVPRCRWHQYEAWDHSINISSAAPAFWGVNCRLVSLSKKDG